MCCWLGRRLSRCRCGVEFGGYLGPWTCHRWLCRILHTKTKLIRCGGLRPSRRRSAGGRHLVFLRGFFLARVFNLQILGWSERIIAACYRGIALLRRVFGMAVRRLMGGGVRRVRALGRRGSTIADLRVPLCTLEATSGPSTAIERAASERATPVAATVRS